MRYVEKLNRKEITFKFESQSIKCFSGMTVASALLASGEIIFRISAQSNSGRGPYCLMGICFECLVEIDGCPNRQACMIQVENDMVIKRQAGSPSLNFSKNFPSDPT